MNRTGPDRKLCMCMWIPLHLDIHSQWTHISCRTALTSLLSYMRISMSQRTPILTNHATSSQHLSLCGRGWTSLCAAGTNLFLQIIWHIHTPSPHWCPTFQTASSFLFRGFPSHVDYFNSTTPYFWRMKCNSSFLAPQGSALGPPIESSSSCGSSRNHRMDPEPHPFETEDMQVSFDDDFCK